MNNSQESASNTVYDSIYTLVFSSVYNTNSVSNSVFSSVIRLVENSVYLFEGSIDKSVRKKVWIAKI